jgi:hypothetical protein
MPGRDSDRKEGGMKRLDIVRRLVLIIGLLAIASAGVMAEDEKEPAEEKERAIEWKDLPAAVQTTILEQAGDHPLVELEEVTVEGCIFYEAEWIEGENEVEVAVAPDGKLLGREVEPIDEDDEDGDLDEEEDDHP